MNDGKHAAATLAQMLHIGAYHGTWVGGWRGQLSTQWGCVGAFLYRCVGMSCRDVCPCVCASMCVCVCVSGRGRERGRLCVYVRKVPGF